MSDTRIAEYWKVKDALTALDARNAPLVAARDKMQGEFEPKLRALNDQVRAAQAPRAALSQELAFLARGLGTKIAERPASE